jgi:tRNA G46 methylase TrmB
VKNPSSTVTSSQAGPHQGLAELLRRHQSRSFSREPAQHTRDVFSGLVELIGERPERLILDSGCGTGASTRSLAERFPECIVLGIDKSAHRLGLRGSRETISSDQNCILARADLVDFWQLAQAIGWQPVRHYLLYPNPWPKPGHLQRRWHGHPVFQTMLKLGGVLELRSNWKIYVQEFAEALSIVTGLSAEPTLMAPDKYISPFERKYAESGHALYQLTANLSHGSPT